VPEGMAEKKDANQTDERATEVREHLANERTLLSWVRTGVENLPAPRRSRQVQDFWWL
jgi:uncharacterized membrane protein YidH (DUF202 family)